MGSPGKVGSAEYELDLDTSEFKAKAQEAGDFLKNVLTVAAGVEFQRLSNELRQLGGDIFKLVADFDHYIITLGSQGAVAQQTAQDIANAMLDMSRSTLFGASEIVVAVAGIAQRLETLTGREVNVADATEFMAHATDLAVASSSDLTSATSTLINVMLAYEIPLERVAEATDLVFNLSRITGVEFITLALAADRLKARLGEAAPSLEDTGSVLAMVNELGITGSRGLLVLVSGIESLTSGSKEVNNELNRLGVGVYDAQGNFVGFRSIIDQLSKAYADMSPQQRQLSSDILFSSQASTILLGLIEKGVGSFDAFNERITTSGTVSTGASQHVQDLNGQIIIFRNNITATTIALGNQLEPAVTKLISSVNALLGPMAENEDLMLAISVIAAGVLVSALIAVSVAFYAVAGAAVVAFIAANAALLGIPIAIAVVVAAVILLIRHFEEVRDWFTSGGWATLALAIANPFAAAINEIRRHWEQLFEILPAPFQNLVIFIAEIMDQVINTILNGLRELDNALPEAISPWDIPGNVDLSGELRGRQAEQQARERRISEQERQNQELREQRETRTSGRPTQTGGTGPPVIPPFTPDPAKKPKELSDLEKDLRALAAAWAIFHEQTGGSIEDFMVFLKLQEANLDLQQRERDALTALNTSTMLLNNSSYQLRLTWVQMAEEAARTGRSLNSVIRDVFDGLADKAKSLLDEILNGPTREGTELQLRIDRLQRQANLLLRGGADSSRVDNEGKSGQPQPTAADRRLRTIENEIKALELESRIRQNNIDIMKGELLLKDKTLQSDRDLVLAKVFLGAVIENLTGTVKNLDDAMGGLIGRLQDTLGIPRLNVGMPYVPHQMLAVLDPGEAVLTARQNSEYRAGLGQPQGPMAAFNFNFNGMDFDLMKRQMNAEYDNAVWEMRRRGTAIPKGTFSGR